jgi:hypothetical protein
VFTVLSEQFRQALCRSLNQELRVAEERRLALEEKRKQREALERAEEEEAAKRKEEREKRRHERDAELQGAGTATTAGMTEPATEDRVRTLRSILFILF